jgi:aryl carrier-like protein
MGQDCLTGAGAFVPALRRDRDEGVTLTAAVATLHVRGVSVDWEGYFGGRRPMLDLPTYAFQHERFWPEAPRPAEAPDAGFWDAVERADVAALADGLDVEETALQAVLPLLQRWRRRGNVREDRRHTPGWEEPAGLTTPVLSGRWLVVAPEGDELADACGTAMAAHGAEVVRAGKESDRADDIAGILSFLPPVGSASDAWYATRGAVSVTLSDPPPDDDQAELWHLAPRAVDLPPSVDDRIGGWLCAILGSRAERVALRASGPFVPALARSRPRTATEWRVSGTVLLVSDPGDPGDSRDTRDVRDSRDSRDSRDEVIGWLTARGAEQVVVAEEPGAIPGLVARHDPVAVVQIGGDARTMRLLDQAARGAGLSAFVLAAPGPHGDARAAAVVRRRRALGLPATAVTWAGDVTASTAIGVALDHGDAVVVVTDQAAETTEAPKTVVSLRERLAALPAAEWPGTALAEVRNQTAAVLGHATPDAVDPDTDFMDMGMSSLAAVELRNRLTALTGLELPFGILYDAATPAELAEYLLAQLAEGSG